MDDKAITAVSTSLALMQIQVNALVLLLEQQSGCVGQRGLPATYQRRCASRRDRDHAGDQEPHL